MEVMIRCVSYTRVSSDEQTHNYSLEIQEDACIKFAKQQKYEVVKVFREEGASAKTISGRPVLRELIKYCLDKKNSISVVLVYKYDRWSRNVAEGTAAIALLAKNGIEVKSVTEPSENNAMGKAMRGMMLVFAELDNNVRSERTTVGLRAAFESGRCPWKAKIGYRHVVVNDKKSIELIRPYRPILQKLFQNAASGIYSKQLLADSMNKDGYGELWGTKATTKTVDKILQSKFYFGVIESKKWGAEVKGIHETVVSEDVWTKANTAIYNKSLKWKNPTSINDFILKGQVLCGYCQRPLRGSYSHGHGGRYGYYHCNNQSCPSPTRINNLKAEEKFKKYLTQFTLSTIQKKLLEAVLIGKLEYVVNQQEVEIIKINNQLSQLEKDKMNIVKSVGSGLVTEQESVDMMDKLRADEVILKLERGEYCLDREEGKVIINFTYNFLSDIGSYWERLDPLKKARLQSVIFPDKVFIKNGEYGTTTISPSFELIKSFTEQVEPMVTLRGIGPRLTE